MQYFSADLEGSKLSPEVESAQHLLVDSLNVALPFQSVAQVNTTTCTSSARIEIAFAFLLKPTALSNYLFTFWIR